MAREIENNPDDKHVDMEDGLPKPRDECEDCGVGLEFDGRVWRCPRCRRVYR
jgi:tRNA(Ile2) C34 agmatinyltransferase TiaS